MMNLYEVARFLEAHDNYDILTHAYPDGDTLGSGFALCLALHQIGKKARVITTGVPSKHHRCSVKVYLSSEKY